MAKFRPTLRFVISFLCAIIVLIVAIVTLAITYSVSLSTVRDIGRKHSLALATTARVQAEGHFKKPVEALNTYAALHLTDGWYSPSNDPANPDPSIHDKYFHYCYGFMLISDFNITGLGAIFDDGAGWNCQIRPHLLTNERVFHFESRSAFGWPESRNMTGVRRQVYLDTQFEVPAAVREANLEPYVVNVDSRIATYPTSKAFVTPDRSGFWFPPVAFINAGATEPEVVLAAIKPFYNRTDFLGLGILSQPTAQLGSFLRGVLGTSNTQAFALETNGGWMLGSTHPTPFLTYTPLVDGSAVLPVGCASTADTSFGLNPIDYVVCRQRARDFSAYAPLQAAWQQDNGAFVSTSGSKVELLSVDGEGNFFVVSTRVTSTYRLFGLNIVLSMPESDVLGDIVSGRNTAIGVTVGVFVLAVVLSFVLVFALLQPLTDVSQRMTETAKLKESENIDSYSSLAEIQDLQKAYTNMNTAIKSFTRYVPRDVVKDLMASGQLCEIKMNPQLCTMLFVDIAGFTTICERVPPDTLSDLVSQYFDRASRIVMEHDGLIDKFIGDCIMAVWGAPFELANQEVKATLCGTLLNRATMVQPLASAWDEAGELVRIRVGVSTGDVLAGNMGSADRMNYTVIGDPVNLAARLEAMNKQFDSRVMVSEMTAERLGSIFVLRLLMPIAVVGKEQAVKVYEVLGLAREFDPSDMLRFATEDEKYGTVGENDTASDVGSTISTKRDSAASRVSGASRYSEVPASGAASGDGKKKRKRRGIATTAAMLRDAQIKTASDVPLTCTMQEVQLAKQATAAVELYIDGRFGEAIDAIHALEKMTPPHLLDGDSKATPEGPTGPGTADEIPLVRCAGAARRSIDLVKDLCEKYLKEGKPANFDGVYRALEK